MFNESDEEIQELGDWRQDGQPALPIEMSPASAREIEIECGLPVSSVAAGRKMTPAEIVYLSVPKMPDLALHVDLYSSNLALVVFEQGMAETNKQHLKGAEFLNPSDARDYLEYLWAALVSARAQGHHELLAEDLSVSLNGISRLDPQRRFSWSIRAEAVMNVFMNAPRPLLLGPKFEQVPPPGKDLPSPGLCISGLKVESYLEVYSIIFQGVTSLLPHDASSLHGMAKNVAKNVFKKETGES